MPTARNQMTITFDLEKQTPGTFRYQEREEPGHPVRVGTLYLKRSAAAKLGNPQTLIVVVGAAS